ncbi:chondroitinase-B domain-containing protein [Winogradskyella vidalii]|uniref:chondroitinase-B domain-containing protein n=1 Tax=Winogradskyella vidalii TaxID=2615024 RepID=UPI0015CCCAF7|nr:chondroitinase-B domain-containing protein [Winogradskyella vidalii]
MIYKITFFKLLFLAFFSIGNAQISSVEAIQNALSSATEGSIITIENGTYSNGDFSIEANGTFTNRITIQAQTPGGVIFDNCRIKMGGTYITLTGVVFSGTYNFSEFGANSYVISFKNISECSNCKVSQVKIEDYNPPSNTSDLRWIRVYGQDNEISYNTFINKDCLGSMIFNQRSSGIEDRMKIHHNYFAFRNQVGIADEYNDVDVIRIGDSSQSLSDSSSEVYDNYFYEVKGGEPEIIANKSGNNQYYRNTFENYLGALSLRHGNGCSVYNNFFLNDGKDESYFNGGIRIIGENHKIYNNYIQGTNATKQNSSSKGGGLGAINISATQSNNDQLSGYGPIHNVMVVNNTIVDCDLGIRIGVDTGGSGQNVAPNDIIVANNLIVDCEVYVETERPATNSVFEGNLYDTGIGDAAIGFAIGSGFLESELNTDGIYAIANSSPAIDGSIGTHGQAIFNDDVFGGLRSGVFDVGAQEYGATITNTPYKQSDVGVSVGFGAAEGPVLMASESLLVYAGLGGDLNVEIITESDTNWNFVDNLSWISLSSNNGVGGDNITITATDNSDGTDREGAITLTADNGAAPIVINITQSTEAFIPEEIVVDASVGVGTEEGKDNVATDFAHDDVYPITNAYYWSANPEDGEASITFDLSCNHTLTEIGIHFLKSDERTTNFDLAVAADGSDTFTTILANQDSSIAPLSEEQLFSLDNSIARYVKITGYGNSSSSSNWVSIAEVNVYGDIACDDSLSSSEFELRTANHIRVFPVPVHGDALTITSSKIAIGAFEIFNSLGQNVMTMHANYSKNISVNVEQLKQGMYFVVLEGLGTAKFVKY